MLTRVGEEKRESAQSSAVHAAQKRAEIEKINLRLERPLDSFLNGVIERDDYTVEKARLMSRKKSLQEQRTALAQGQIAWIEPIRKWILAAKNAGNTALSGSPESKKVLAQ